MQAFICVCRSTCYSSFPEGIKPPGPFCSLFFLHCVSWKALASVNGAHPCSVCHWHIRALNSPRPPPVQDTLLISDAPLLEITTAVSKLVPAVPQPCPRTAVPTPPHTHHQSLWMAYQAEMVPPKKKKRNGPSCFKGPLSSGVMLSILASVKGLLITSSSENCYVFTHFSVELWVTFRLVFKNSSSSGDVSRPL